MEIEVSGLKLKQLREQREMSVHDIARRLRLPVQQIKTIEQHSGLLPEEALFTLSKVFGVVPDDFYLNPPTNPLETWWIWTDTQRRSYRTRILDAYVAYREAHGVRPTEILLETHVAKQVHHHVPGFLLSTRFGFDYRKVGFRRKHQPDHYPVSCPRSLVHRLAKTWEDALSSAPGLVWPLLFASMEITDPVEVVFGGRYVAAMFAEIVRRSS